MNARLRSAPTCSRRPQAPANSSPCSSPELGLGAVSVRQFLALPASNASFGDPPRNPSLLVTRGALIKVSAVNMATPPNHHATKVPEVTLGFWIIKILATTLGETGGDTFSMTMDLGYLASSAIFLAV